MLKYDLYEMSVQSPATHVQMFVDMYEYLRGKTPRRLREDFCGTFRISSQWVRRHENNTAVGIDLDPEPLKVGLIKSQDVLTLDQKARLELIRGDVLKATPRAADLVAVCNFSFYIFKRRPQLLRYFKRVRQGLNPGGIVVLEMSGGPGMIEEMRERKTIRRKGFKPFVYVWDQISFDPVTHDAKFAIHFKFKGGRQLKNAFTYDWRLWSIPEVRELLHEAGFKKSKVFWETESEGEGTGEYLPVDQGTNDYAWCTYVVGMK